MDTSHIVYKAECNKHKGFGLMFKWCSQCLSIIIELGYRIPDHFICMRKELLLDTSFFKTHRHM